MSVPECGAKAGETCKNEAGLVIRGVHRVGQKTKILSKLHSGSCRNLLQIPGERHLGWTIKGQANFSLMRHGVTWVRRFWTSQTVTTIFQALCKALRRHRSSMWILRKRPSQFVLSGACGRGKGREPSSFGLYLLASTIGTSVDNCKFIRRSMRRSIWYHNAVFLGEITFSNIGTYFIRNARRSWSTAVDLLM